MSRRRRLSTFSLKGPKNSTDIEALAGIPLQRGKSISAAELRYLELIFGVPEEALRKYPGLYAFCQHVEDSFGPLLGETYAPVWKAFGLPPPTSAHDCWSLPNTVLQSLRDHPQDVSIDTVLGSLLHSPKAAALPSRPFCQIAVFAVLCWATMTLTPSLQCPSDTPQLACEIPGRYESEETLQHLKLDRCKRAISVAFRGFKTDAWGRDVMQSGQQDIEGYEDLYEASLNYSSLQMFGKIHIQWVSTMTAHLDFDPASRCLLLFRFPSMCALKAVDSGKHLSPVLKSICADFDPLPVEDKIRRYITLEQEILLSYRLLFGQSAASRKVAQRELASLKKDGSSFDQLLTTLCQKKYRKGILWWSKVDRDLDALTENAWPISCRDGEKHLQERDVYSAMEDFPRLGRRLLRLQKFNLRQRPSKLTDLWRDRRNPLQWYTFWVVLIIGGMSNLLALLQLLVAVYQTVPGSK